MKLTIRLFFLSRRNILLRLEFNCFVYELYFDLIWTMVEMRGKHVNMNQIYHIGAFEYFLQVYLNFKKTVKGS